MESWGLQNQHSSTCFDPLHIKGTMGIDDEVARPACRGTWEVSIGARPSTERKADAQAVRQLFIN
eukprot:scaffold272404_cov17-Tisochrysis_lutea.AAC.2